MNIDMFIPLASFVAGAAFVAFIREIVARFFYYPVVDFAVAEISLACTRNKAHKTIPVPDSLQRKLTENPTSHVSWGDRFTSEYDVEFSLLEILELERMAEFEVSQLDDLLNQLTEENIREKVNQLGRNQQLILTCINSLISNPVETKTNYDEIDEVYQVQKVKTLRDGNLVEVIHLDLPGNPFPIIGSPRGLDYIDEKAKPLILSMSHCHPGDLKTVIENAKLYNQKLILELVALREEFLKLKKQRTHIVVRILLTNLGKTTALLSSSCVLKIQGAAPVNLEFLEYEESAETQRFAVQVRDRARKLVEWSPSATVDISQFESRVNVLSIEPNEAKTLGFVTSDQVGADVISALNALTTGYATCTLSFDQHVSRRMRALSILSRYTKTITSHQKLYINEK